MDLITQRLKSKTYRLGLLVVALGYIQEQLPQYQELLKDYYGIATTVIGGLILILRELTKKPLSEK